MYKFSNAKVGDLVFSIHNGWCKISSIDAHDRLPIMVDGKNCVRYTFEGKYYLSDECPSLFLPNEVPEIYLKDNPRPRVEVEEERTVYVNVYESYSRCHDYEDLAICMASRDKAFYVALPVKYTVKIKK